MSREWKMIYGHKAPFIKKDIIEISMMFKFWVIQLPKIIHQMIHHVIYLVFLVVHLLPSLLPCLYRYFYQV